MNKAWSAKDIKSLLQLSSLINSSLDINEVLDNSMRVVEDLIDAEASSIFEVDFEKSELFFRLARGESGGKVKEQRMKMGEGIAGWVASSGEPLLVPDTEKDERFTGQFDGVTGFKTRSIIALPVRNKGRVTGVLEVINKRGRGIFSSKDIEVLSIVANQIGIAMENARLYERLKGKFALTRTELKETQDKLIRSERLAALGELSKGVAHTVRNPVMSIGGFAKRLKKKLPAGDSAAGYLDLIITESERLEQIVHDVHEYTTMPEPRQEHVRMSVFLEEAIRDCKQSYGSDNLKIELKLLPDDPLVFVDSELMTKACILLLKNAREAISEGGILSIAACREDKWIVISIRDNGCGIQLKDLPFVFDPFFTTKTHGSGLGLTTVNRIVCGHRGEIKIFSSPGTETEVRIYFPTFSSSE
jgi:signal transduction histidine kinase